MTSQSSKNLEWVPPSTSTRKDSPRRERTQSWDRVVVYDTETGNINIRKKQDVDKGERHEPSMTSKHG
jgi:hypothetical protein